MLFQPNERIEEQLVRMLGSAPGLTADVLHGRLLAVGGNYSLQAVYKELTKLISQGILTKNSGRYFLNSSWIFELRTFSQMSYDALISDTNSSTILPLAGKPQKSKFRNLQELDDYWGHLLVVLLKFTSSRRLFEFISHPWYELIHHHKENLFRSTLRSLGKKIYMIIENDGALTRRIIRHWKSDIAEISTSLGPFQSEQGKILNVIDDYIVEIRIPNKLQNRIAELFDRIDSGANVETGEIFEVFKLKGDISMVVAENPKKAKRLNRQFQDFFGILK